jgi:hypothetical protein
MKIASAILVLCLCSVALADDLTIDGVTYQDVRYGSVRGNSVTIFHRTGVATVPIASLAPDLQKKLGYDPEKAQADAEQAAKLKTAEDAKWRAAGYTTVNGRWVSPQDAAKYLDKDATSRALRNAMSAELVHNSQVTGAQFSQQNITLLALISDSDYHRLDVLTENRHALTELKKYGFASYQPSIAEFLQVCDDGIDIYREYQRADPDWFKAERQADSLSQTAGRRPTSSAEMGIAASRNEQKARAEAFRNHIEQLRKDAKYHYQQGLDFKFEQDAKL